MFDQTYRFFIVHNKDPFLKKKEKKETKRDFVWELNPEPLSLESSVCNGPICNSALYVTRGLKCNKNGPICNYTSNAEEP